MFTTLKKRGTMVALGAVLALGVAACPAAEDEPEPVEEPVEEPVDEVDEDPEPEPEAAPGDPFAELKAAAHHVGAEGSARALVEGIAAGAGLEGDLDSPAAQTWAQLSTLLSEHVYLAGITVDTAYSFGLDSGEFELAAGALDENSQEIADIIGDAAGEDNREAFLDLWREHIGFFVDYAVATAEGDEEGRHQAVADLDGYRAQAGAFFEDITGGELPADAVEASLEGHVNTVAQAVDALAAGDADAFDRLKEAADHVSTDGSARALADGFVAALELEGDLDAPAVGAYVQLSTLLEEHVYLAGIAVKTGFAEGLDSGEFQAAAGTLDTNSVAIADLVGSVAGEDNREAFLDLWREHIGFFVDYARGAAGGDEELKQQAVADLDGYRAQAGAFFEDITGGELPADAVEASLEGHVNTVAQAVDSLAAAMN